MFAENSPTFHLREFLLKHLPSGIKRPLPILSLKDAQCASHPAALSHVFDANLSHLLYFLDGTRYSNKTTDK